MADSDERKSFQSEYESDGDGPSPLRWTARRTEASDDDDSFEGEVVKRKFRCGSRCDESESECNDEGEPEYSEGGVVVIGEELEEVSQEEKEEEVCETVRFVKGEENQVLSPDFGPKHGFFYMHDDRFQSNRRYGSRRIRMLQRITTNIRGRTEARDIGMKKKTRLDHLKTLEIQIRHQELLKEEGL